MGTNRRKFKRFVVQDMVFAVFRPHFMKLGKIKDISKGGMAFEYVTFEGPKEDSSQLDLFVSGARFHLPHIPAKTVYDSAVTHNPYTFSPFVERRRCGVEFGELTEDQTQQLKHLLENYTTGVQG